MLEQKINFDVRPGQDQVVEFIFKDKFSATEFRDAMNRLNEYEASKVDSIKEDVHIVRINKEDYNSYLPDTDTRILEVLKDIALVNHGSEQSSDYDVFTFKDEGDACKYAQLFKKMNIKIQPTNNDLGIDMCQMDKGLFTIRTDKNGGFKLMEIIPKYFKNLETYAVMELLENEFPFLLCSFSDIISKYKLPENHQSKSNLIRSIIGDPHRSFQSRSIEISKIVITESKTTSFTRTSESKKFFEEASKFRLDQEIETIQKQAKRRVQEKVTKEIEKEEIITMVTPQPTIMEVPAQQPASSYGYVLNAFQPLTVPSVQYAMPFNNSFTMPNSNLSTYTTTTPHSNHPFIAPPDIPVTVSNNSFVTPVYNPRNNPFATTSQVYPAQQSQQPTNFTFVVSQIYQPVQQLQQQANFPSYPPSAPVLPYPQAPQWNNQVYNPTFFSQNDSSNLPMRQPMQPQREQQPPVNNNYNTSGYHYK